MASISSIVYASYLNVADELHVRIVNKTILEPGSFALFPIRKPSTARLGLLPFSLVAFPITERGDRADLQRASSVGHIANAEINGCLKSPRSGTTGVKFGSWNIYDLHGTGSWRRLHAEARASRTINTSHSWIDRSTCWRSARSILNLSPINNRGLVWFRSVSRWRSTT